MVFNEFGGYVQKEINERQRITDDNARNQRMERNEELLASWTENLANRTADLTFWTRLVAIGAIGLVVWEVIAFLWEHHFFYYH